ncbi:MAG: tol-pal system protein YbgF, partial [Mariprofundaceae bacterium]
ASIKAARAASAAATVVATANGNEEENAYTAAYLELKSGRYDEAIASFKKFLDVYPKGNFSDQAYFWLGEGHLAQKRYNDAIDSFKMLVTTFPGSPKLPATLLKLGLAYENNGQGKEAIKAYHQLLRDHADSDSVVSAQKRLDAIVAKTGK